MSKQKPGKTPKHDTPARKPATNKKVEALQEVTEVSDGTSLTTNQGLPINDDQNSLKAGERGPSLLEDFHLREKITHFDHERIPERIVHARGSAAHGVFQVYKSLAKYTTAHFLQNPALKTPVFVRFSTVAGSRGSTDLARDVRGFATKFYTEEGNYDLVGNNMPVFFIQDALKFPDLVHSVKPEPHHEMPQAASAHDTFWDFVSRTPEATHMVFWAMSDRAIPRSYRMMEGFGVHTFRLINAKGEARFVKFHWKPVLGLASVTWEEAQLISGKDSDFHRRDLWEAIESGNYPEWELGLQIVEEKDEHKFDFDLLDPTKLIPEELVPVEIVGKMTLNRNPDNFFAETEQVQYNPGHIVSGIDFPNDPLLQGRLFSYTDTQLIRLGGPNFHEIPINRAIAPVHNNQRDGFMRQTINRGQTSYEPNSLNGNFPKQVKAKDGGFVSYTERIDGRKIRARSKSFFDHFSQAAMFYQSQAPIEQDHIAQAFEFELGKVETPALRERYVAILNEVDEALAARVAKGLGIAVPKLPSPINENIPADGDPKEFQPPKTRTKYKPSKALSIILNPTPGIKTHKAAILVSDGVDDASLSAVTKALQGAGAIPFVIANHMGFIKTAGGKSVKVEGSLLNQASVLFDACFVPGGAKSIASLKASGTAIHFIQETYRHYKTIGAAEEGTILVMSAVASCPEGEGADLKQDPGVVLSGKADGFIKAMGQKRHWNRRSDKSEDGALI